MPLIRLRAHLKVLVVEDEWLIADHLQAIVEDCGYGMMGPAPSVDCALELIETARPDAALIDVMLGGQRSYPLAETLRERGVPFVLMTGYAPGDLPTDLGQAALLHKPINEAEIGKMLETMLPDR